MIKPIISLFCGHDTNVTIYNPATNRFHIFDLDKLDNNKHYNCNIHAPEKNTNVLKKILRIAEEQYGIKNDYGVLLVKSQKNCRRVYKEDLDEGKFLPLGTNIYRRSNFDLEVINHEEYVQCETEHHALHTLCGFAQSPFESAIVLSADGGGDATHFKASKFKDGRLIDSYDRAQRLSLGYTITGLGMPMIKNNTQHSVDYAGKIMGLSAYGDINNIDMDRFSRYFNMMSYYKCSPEHRLEWHYILNSGRLPDVFIKTYRNYLTKTYDIHNPKVQEDIAAAAQYLIEKHMLEIVETEIEKIEDYDNNLVLVGGTFMNVLVNEKIKVKYPHLNIYVPENPHDGGLGFGVIMDYFGRNNYPQYFEKYNLHQAGCKLWDHKNLDNMVEEAEEITIPDLCDDLKDGKIVAFVSGNVEIGPRALGFRSILCDPSYPEMQLLINEKIKHREYYRPFAPVCRKEDAEIYFDSPHFENMNFMSFAVKVKPEYRSVYPSITHIDNTARLQTVTEFDNKILYDILTEFDGILLNTSLNLAGHPIYNSMDAILRNMGKTQMDYVVLHHNNKLYKFNI
jgi:carbamoyltransferase